jgi:hypothetical protein
MSQESEKKRYRLEWIAAPRPPTHKNPMVGALSFPSLEAARTFFLTRPGDAKVKSLVEIITRENDLTAEFTAMTERA